MNNNNNSSSKKSYSNPNKSSRDDLPSWIKFPLKKYPQNVRYCASVIMDHYLIVLVQDCSPEDRERYESKGYDLSGEDPASLLAFDLLDHSIQEAEIDIDLFGYQDFYTFTKYGENQILKYQCRNSWSSNFVRITVESFQPFKVRCEELEMNKKQLLMPTAQVYQDCLYTYGLVHGRGYDDDTNELWSFDLKNQIWELCETSGEGPKNLIEPAEFFTSFIFGDFLAVYGGQMNDRRVNRGEVFLLNLNTMEWTKIEQQQQQGDLEYGGVLYKDHLVILDDDLKTKESKLCCLNLKTKNNWKTFNINYLEKVDCVDTGGMMVYNNLLLDFAQDEDKNLILAVLNLEHFGICASKSAEEEKISNLFMSETDSDIAFNIEEKVIPAHKSVLMKKSRYFEKVFKSGMAESRQKTIQLKGCKYDIFQEYLRFIYQDTVDFGGDINRAMKLYTLADKFLQSDLQEKCLNYLICNIKGKNFYEILDFAHKKNALHLTHWCFKFFEDHINSKNMVGLLDYIKSQDNENNQELIEKACTLINKKFSKIFEKKNSENIENDHFKEAVFRFVQENLEIIMTSDIAKDFTNGFLVDFTRYQGRNPCNTCKKTSNSKKRIEPVKDDDDNINEGNPELKKTKK